MSDFASNNWELAQIAKKFGKSNSLKNLNLQGSPPFPTQIQWESAGTTLREQNYKTKETKKPKFRPQKPSPVFVSPPITTNPIEWKTWYPNWNLNYQNWNSIK